MDPNILEAFGNVFSPYVLILMVLGVAYGIVFGSIPGLTAATAVALLIPLTYPLSSPTALSLIIAVYIGGVSGGLISAILLRIPGTASSVATTLDGYALAQKGFVGKALGYGIFSSFIGGILSGIVLIIISPQLAILAVKFGPFEYFSVAVFALSMVSILSRGNRIKGFLSCFLGMLFATVGMSPIDGARRFTFGSYQLNSGFQILSVLIGLFAVSEMLKAMGKFGSKDADKVMKFSTQGGYFPRLKEIWKNRLNFLRSAAIGTVIGILPGLGGGPGGLLAYAQAKKASKTPQEFGNGSPEGIIAAETANNAVTGGALIPMLTLGVPGESVTAIIMSAFIIHGVKVGPLLFRDQSSIVYTIFIAVLVANVIMILLEALAIRSFAKILQLPNYYLFPYIMVFCVVGVNGINNRLFDVWGMLVFGIIGFILERNKYPLPPFILAYILGSMLEESFRRTLMYYDGFFAAFVQAPIGSALLILTVIIPLSGLILKQYKKKRKMKTGPIE